MTKKVKLSLLFIFTIIATAIYTILVYRSLQIRVYPQLKGTYTYHFGTPSQIYHHFIDGQFSQTIDVKQEEVIGPYEKISDNIYLINKQFYLILHEDNTYDFILSRNEIAQFTFLSRDRLHPFGYEGTYPIHEDSP